MAAEVNVANNNNNTTTQTASQTTQSTGTSNKPASDCSCQPVVVNFYIGCCPSGKSS